MRGYTSLTNKASFIHSASGASKDRQSWIAWKRTTAYTGFGKPLLGSKDPSPNRIANGRNGKARTRAISRVGMNGGALL